VDKFLDANRMCSFGLEIISDLQYPVDDVAEQKNQRDKDFAVNFPLI